MWVLIAVLIFHRDVPGEALSLTARWEPVATLEQCQKDYELNRPFLEQWFGHEPTANAGYMKCIKVSQ